MLCSYCSALALPRNIKTKKAAGGLARGGELAMGNLDPALRCVLFGPHSVLKDT